MARNIPKVHDGALQVLAGEESCTERIPLGTHEWYNWLEHARSFRFESPLATFTARREQRPGGWYWYAYRRRHGKLRIAYLGKSIELTVERLNAVAAVLAGNCMDDEEQHLQHEQTDHALQTHLTSTPAFPAVRTEPKRAQKHNMPVQLTSFVGREPAIATATALLRCPEVRLMNMVGTGGIGKTRLAIAVATALLEDFSDGIYFVALAPIRTPGRVLPVIAQTLGLKESGNGPIVELVQAYIGSRCLLLVLDNFEHVLAAAPLVEELLITCSRLKLLVTSRSGLHLHAEHQFSVPPLGLPDLKHVSHYETLVQCSAVQLFVQRAQAVKPDFRLHEANAHFIAEICTRLDGLPLAIELAAARIKLLSPQALLSRLDHLLQVLTGGVDDLTERQQTLRNTIQWSYTLLHSKEQQLLRRLSVFVGICTLEAIEAVCAALDNNRAEYVLEGVASLIDKSLLRQSAGEEPHLLMLETVRAYGLEALSASGEAEITRQAHALYYLALVEGVEPAFWGPRQGLWFDRLEQEHGNLLAALNWLLEQGESRKNVEVALRLGGALWWFWFRRGYFSIGAELMERALALTDAQVSAHMRARALRCAGHLVAAHGNTERGEVLLAESVALFKVCGDRIEMGRTFFPFGMIASGRRDLATARKRYEEGLRIAREVGDTLGMANLLHTTGNVARRQGEYETAYALFEESLTFFRELGNKGAIASSRLRLAELHFAQGDLARAFALAEKALALHRELGDTDRVAETLELLGQIALQQRDSATARALFEESLTIRNERRHLTGIAWALSLLASVAAVENDYPAAHTLYEKSLELSLEQSKTQGQGEKIASCLEGFAVVCAAQGEFVRAVHLWGAAEALREAILMPISPIARTAYERSVTAARVQLGEKHFAHWWAQGRSMTPEQALASHGSAILSKLTQEKSQPDDIIPTSLGLTRRERDVLCFLTMGFTSTSIAAQLTISLSTVNTHVRSIYNKLGVTSRSAATRYAIEHHLV